MMVHTISTTRVRIAILPACLGLLLVGCWASPTPPALPPAAPPTPPAAVVQPETAPAVPPVVESPAAVAAEPPAPAAPPISKERILLIAPTNPLIVEFQLTIDGRPHTEALDKLVADVLKLADTDGDGRATWKEIAASKRFKYGQFGNTPIMGENNVKQLIERHDIDRDGLIDASELPRFLTRNAGGSRAFSVRGTADFRHTSRRGSRLWKALDADGDGSLAAADLAAAPGRLLALDLDDDEILVAGELNPPQPLDPGMMAPRRIRGPEIVRLLGPFSDWDAVRLLLEEGYGGRLGPESFPLTPDLFTRLDANHDGKLLKAEFAALYDVPPHLVVAVDFATREGETAREGEAPAEPKPEATPKLRLVSITEKLQENSRVVLEHPGRLALDVAGTTLTLYVNDTLAVGNYQAQTTQALNLLDADKNGYLEEKEVPADAAAQFGQFAAIDADEDGKAYPAEIVAYLTQQQAAMRGQIHAKASDREDILFAALDQNHDERLDAREIENAPKRLAALDTNGDGAFSGDELPELLILGLARGSLENMDALFVQPTTNLQTPAGDAPRWFTSMDANGDGVVSPREFLGSAEKFSEVDANSDGLLDAAEAKAVAGEREASAP